jgi:formate C-acetyltransferase
MAVLSDQRLGLSLPFPEEREAFLAEYDAHYSTYPWDFSPLAAELEAWEADHPEASSYALKARVYELAAERCPVKIFRHSPFYFELVSGRERNSWGFSGIGGWMFAHRDLPLTADLRAGVDEWYRDRLCGSGLWDIDHHCAGYDRLLTLGLRGMLAEAEAALAGAAGESREFLQAVVLGQQAALAIAERFGAEAARLAAAETDPAIRARLELIAQTAPRVPAEPPATFYEALCALFFYRELLCNLEGLGISILGHLDRILEPYYQADLAAGRITPAEAKDLLARYLQHTDARWEWHEDMWAEVSTTLVIGGCDAAGQVVANDLTRMIVECFLELPLINPKLNARVSSASPEWYLELLGQLALSGKNVLDIFNDETLIPSHTFYNKRLEDARLYVAGGCQEPMLANTEYNDRAGGGIWDTNLPKFLLVTLGGITGVTLVENQAEILARAGVRFTAEDGHDFEAVYAAFRRLVRVTWEKMTALTSAGQALAKEVNPCPLMSAGIEDCLATGRDVMAGGARYNVTTIGYISPGTIIDELYALRRAVFAEGRLSLSELASHLAGDYAGAEDLAAYLRSLPKFGHGDDEIDAFAERVSVDLMILAEGLPQGRGGHTEPGYFTYWNFATLGSVTGATPEGRHAGEPYAQGSGPSRMRYPASPTDPLRSQQWLHLERCPGCSVLDLYLPLSRASQTAPQWMAALVRGFIAHRGSVLQMGVLDPELLRRAQEHPEQYAGLQVRVAGFTALFTTLAREVQEEILARMMN